MQVYYRVMLPDWVLDDEDKQWDLANEYMQRYPHYVLVKIEGKFALCQR